MPEHDPRPLQLDEYCGWLEMGDDDITLDTNLDDDCVIDPASPAFVDGQTGFSYIQLTLREDVQQCDGVSDEFENQRFFRRYRGELQAISLRKPQCFGKGDEARQIGTATSSVRPDLCMPIDALPDSLILGSSALFCVEAVIPNPKPILPSLANAQKLEIPMSLAQTLETETDLTGATTYRRDPARQALVDKAVELTNRQLAAHEAKMAAVEAERQARYEASPEGHLEIAEAKVDELEIAFSNAVREGDFAKADQINDALQVAKAEAEEAQAVLDAAKAREAEEAALERTIYRQNGIARLEKIISTKNEEADKAEIETMRRAITRYEAEIADLAELAKPAAARKAKADAKEAAKVEASKPQVQTVIARCGKEVSVWDAYVPHFGEVERRGNISVTTGMSASEIYGSGKGSMISCGCDACNGAIQQRGYTLGHSLRNVKRWDEGRGDREARREANRKPRGGGSNGRRTYNQRKANGGW